MERVLIYISAMLNRLIIVRLWAMVRWFRLCERRAEHLMWWSSHQNNHRSDRDRVRGGGVAAGGSAPAPDGPVRSSVRLNPDQVKKRNAASPPDLTRRESIDANSAHTWHRPSHHLFVSISQACLHATSADSASVSSKVIKTVRQRLSRSSSTARIWLVGD